jgi:hypothetical protein
MTSGGSSAFSPASIPGLQLWLDASQISGLNDGDAVATWNDLSGNGNDVTQATASKKPTYKTGIQNGLPAVLFDGVDDFLLITKAFGLTSGTLFVVYKSTAGSYCVLRTNNDSAGQYFRYAGDGNGYWGVFTTGRIETYPASMPGANVAAYVVDVSSAASKTVHVNGIDKGAQSFTFASPTQINIGDNLGSGGPYMTGYVMEVGLYNSAISAGNLALLNVYLAAKYGI